MTSTQTDPVGVETFPYENTFFMFQYINLFTGHLRRGIVEQWYCFEI